MNTTQLLTPKQAAAFLQVSEKSLADWRRTTTGPAYRRLGHRTVRYLQGDLIDWPGVVSTKASKEAQQ